MQVLCSAGLLHWQATWPTGLGTGQFRRGRCLLVGSHASGRLRPKIIEWVQWTRLLFNLNLRRPLTVTLRDPNSKPRIYRGPCQKAALRPPHSSTGSRGYRAEYARPAGNSALADSASPVDPRRIAPAIPGWAWALTRALFRRGDQCACAVRYARWVLVAPFLPVPVEEPPTHLRLAT